MLVLEGFCDHVEKANDLAVVFGNYEKDEITQSILDFSQFKISGKTPMHFGRPLGRLIDTIYFTHSHHSRFLQLADILVFLANRYEANKKEATSWHERETKGIWERIKSEGIYRHQQWP